jgi:uncharacterized membrane-anchored protein
MGDGFNIIIIIAIILFAGLAIRLIFRYIKMKKKDKSKNE